MDPIKTASDAFTTVKFIDKLTDFEKSHGSFINVILRPLLLLLIFLSVGYYTMWMSTNYVKQDKFAANVEKQSEFAKNMEEFNKTKFDLIQAKLETIINQQISYNEQLKAYNQVITSMQKQMDAMDSRITYLERYKDSKK